MGQLDVRLPGIEAPDSTVRSASPSVSSLASGKQADLGFSPLTKSDSAGAQSYRSVGTVASIPVLGAHPFGTLRIHQPSDQPLLRESGRPRAATASSPSGSNDPKPEHSMGGGDIILVLDLPADFTVGYDTVSYTTRSFHGVRDVPLGAHFVWVSETEATSTRAGVWILSTSQVRIHVLQWDKFNQSLGPAASQVEARFQKENIQALYPKLSPYQYRANNANINDARSGRSSRDSQPEFAKNTNIWHQVTSEITEPLLTRILNKESPDFRVHTSDRVQGARLLPGEIELERSVPTSAIASELSFAFSQVAKTYSTDSVGSARSEQAQDATTHILSFADTPAPANREGEVTGELQLAFLMGMHLGNEICIQQWWHMVLNLVLKAYDLTLKRPRLAHALLQTLTAQLVYNDRYLDNSILDLVPAKELQMSLIVYKRRLNELLLALNSRATEDQAAVGAAFSELESWMWKHGWDIRSDYLRSGLVMLEDGDQVEVEMSDLAAEDERGEYAAVVVDLDDQGRPKDMVSWN